jgi:3,4-dihydroxy 2-butanone 4-phosphate synthase/GTP cyclohydrolase II
LLSNNPEKKRQLEERGIVVTELVPLVVGVGAENEGYLEAKRDRMGHALPSHEVLDEALAAATSATKGNS